MVKALLFDVFGTLVDWRRGVAQQVAESFAGPGIAVDPTAFAVAWRAKYDPAMAPIRAGTRSYQPLDILHRENLEATLADFELTGQLDEGAMASLNHAWEKLPPWPDTVPGLTRLKTRFVIAPCSNGSIALMTWLAKFAGLPWDVILGAEIAKAYKPDPRVYQASATALGLAPDQVMMVAAHNEDLAAARAQGLKTAFLPRPQEHGPDQSSDLSASADWDMIAKNIEDLSYKLIS